MASVPFVATSTGDAADAPSGAVPIDLYGVEGAGSVPAFSEITGSVSGVSGANLQAILEDLATRLAAVETP